MGNWTIAPLSPIGTRYWVFHGQVGDVFYVLCGTIGNGSNTASVEAFDMSTGTWSARTARPYGSMTQGGSCVVGTKIYCFGGQGGGSVSANTTVTIYDTATDSWTIGGTIDGGNYVSYFPTMIAVGTDIYIAGGHPGWQNFHRYNTLNNTFTTNLSTTPNRLYRSAPLVLDGDHIRYFGGVYPTGNPAADYGVNWNWDYRISTNAWDTSSYTPIPRPGGGAFFARLGNEIHLIGRSNGIGTAHDIYDVVNDTWVQGPDKPTGSDGGATGYYNNKIFCYSGVGGAIHDVYSLVPSISGRPITVRSYWKRFMSRNPNYKGRLMEIYEGQVGMAEEEFTRTWVGKLTNVTTQRGEFTFESTDLLKDLSGIDVPSKLDIKLAADLSGVETGQITLTSVEGLGSGAGYIRIKDEIIGYATLNVTTKALQTLTRGAFGTVADEYKSRDKVQAVRYYAAANPWDTLMEMLRVDAGIADADIDLDAFALAKRTPGNDKLFRAVLSEPENLDKLFFEITDILDAKAWVGEDLRITIRRNVQNAPGRAYYRMTDGGNIVDNSASVDFNEKSRLTRMLIYWHKSVLGKKDDPAAFDRLDIAVDAEAEASYGDVVEKKVFCRWIDPITNEEDSAETYVKNLGMRQVRRSRDAQPLIALSLSLRDLGIKTGDHVRLDTDELVKFNGDPITNEIFQVVKRELQDDFSLKVSLLRVSTRRLALIAPDGYPNYLTATDAQKEFGFITLDTGVMENEDAGYYIW